VEIPQHRMGSMQDLADLPVMRSGESRPLLSDVATMTEGKAFGAVERYNMQRVVSLTAISRACRWVKPRGRYGRRSDARGSGAWCDGSGAGSDSGARRNAVRLGDWIADCGWRDLSAADSELSIARLAFAIFLTLPWCCAALRCRSSSQEDAEYSIVSWRDYGARNRDGEFDFAGHIRGSASAGREQCDRFRAACGVGPFARDPNDGGRDDRGMVPLALAIGAVRSRMLHWDGL